jgi:uncharacterized protein (TIGR02646 family)
LRNIQKQAEPTSLTQHRCNQHTDYDNYAEMGDLRVSLTTEQQGICCYCLQRIRASDTDMKVEHWQCQNRYPQRQLDYANLLGACRGGEGRRSRDQTCDTKKGNSDLSYSPASHDVEVRVRYLGDGTIESDDTQFDSEINDVLNLNEGRLMRNRKSVLDAFKERLRKKGATDADLRSELASWNGHGGGDLSPFCQVIVHYLKKKLKIA